MYIRKCPMLKTLAAFDEVDASGGFEQFIEVQGVELCVYPQVPDAQDLSCIR